MEMDRLYNELDWFGKNQIEFIFVCDANFGMLPRDYEIVQKAIKVKQNYGYPHVLSVQGQKMLEKDHIKSRNYCMMVGYTKVVI